MTQTPERDRPEPDELLARYGQRNSSRRQGRLKIFLGAAPGVGKTYAMLQAARMKHRRGLDVAVGLIEPHGRPETAALIEGLEVLPRRSVVYRETALTELDLDAALARRPQLLLVDELAHTNAPGSRHAKRFQDVLELLDVGIDVWTTLNIQHLESLRDVVSKITGVVVRETLPDNVLERADEIELVDLGPADLRRRLEEGKVYSPNVARKALEHFFTTGNLIALRELALRAAAEHVGAAMETYRKDHALTEPWSASERLLVCVGPSADSGRVVRLASRMAKQLRAEWHAVHVEQPRLRRGAELGRNRALEHLRLAEHLGAQTRVLQGRRVASALLDFARDRNVTTVLLGRPRPRHRFAAPRPHLVDALVANQDDIQVYVVTGEAKAADARRPPPPAASPPTDWRDYGVASLAVGLATIVAALVRDFVALVDLAMLLLLVVLLLSYFTSRGPSLFAAVLSVAALDFFFVPPFYTFAVTHAEYLLTFAVMAGVGLAASTLAARIKEQAIAAQSREQLTAALYGLTRSLAACDSREELVESAVRQIWETFRTDVFIGLLGPDRRVAPMASMGRKLDEPAEQVTAQWTAHHGKPSGAGTETLPGVEGFYLPLAGLEEPLGVVGVRPRSREQFDDPEQRHLLETFVSQTALALGRATLTHQAREARVIAEMEQMRSSLLSSVSHDLRTPLGSIMGAASVLRDPELHLPPERRAELLRSIHEEAARLERLLENLLEMTRISGGALQVRKEWHVPEEVIGSALGRLSGELARRPVKVEIAPDIGLVPFDALLIELVLLNLIENAIKYTPDGCPIAIRAVADDESLTFEVIDDGPGLGPGDETRVFEKFYRAGGRGRPGAGLGLTICKALVEAHGGAIEAANRGDAQGAVFRVWLPRAGTPPSPPDELDELGEPPPPHAVDAAPGVTTMTDATAHILIVEDEADMRRFLEALLAGHGYRVIEAALGREGLVEVATRNPDVILLDLGLPDMDGLEFTRRVREESQVPIIVISARGQEKDKIDALDLGADDYLTKPFDAGELLARVRVALRRASWQRAWDSQPEVSVGPLRVDLAARQVTRDGAPVHLTRLEYKLLAVLVQNAGKVLTHRHILKAVWGPAYVDHTHYVRVYMAQLRQKVEADPSQPRYLITETGVGYRLRAG